MTRIANPSKSKLATITDLMGVLRFRMYRTSGNTSGRISVGIGSSASAAPIRYMDIDVTLYPASAWTAFEYPFDLTGASYSGQTLAVVAVVPYYGQIQGGPVYLADFDLQLMRDASVMWMKAKTSAYVLLPSDAGRSIKITTGGVTVGTALNECVDGSIWTVINDSGSNQTITASGVTLYQAGTANTGNRTLAQRGWCNIVKLGTNAYSIAGPGIS